MKTRTVSFAFLTSASLLMSAVVTGTNINRRAAVTIRQQATNPPYLSQFPAPSRVKAEVKGSDPVDTSARVMAHALL